jgi:hypothetical protein
LGLGVGGPDRLRVAVTTDSVFRESPEEFHFLSANQHAPPPVATTAFKPAMKVLSRKPAPQMIAKRDPVTGLQQMTLQDDDDDEESAVQETPEERKARQQRERDEKERRYAEARAKIFGEPKSGPPSGQSSPGNLTPPPGGEGRQNYRGRGRGRGGNRGGIQTLARADSQEKRPGQRELFDPSYAPKPGFALQKRGEEASSQPGRSTTPKTEDQVVRAPRGPDGSGRGGFGFARRGGGST